MILLLDNYDSFTYNLYQYLSELGAEPHVVRNDQATIEELDMLGPDRVVISPGPSNPSNAGISVDAIRHFAQSVPVLGVCLGHQCIGFSFGGIVDRAGEIIHGKTSEIFHDGKGVLRNIQNPFQAIRYHSLVVFKESLPECLEISAWTENGLIMGLRHKEYPVEGVQFHPESILTPSGKDILRNFLGEYPIHSKEDKISN